MNRLGLGLAVGAGYVLGRTKKMKLAFAVGTMVAGKRMHLSPRALADLVAGQLRDNPQFKEIGDQLREDLRGVGKAASGALVERQIEGLADRLHGRTAEVRDQLAGVVPDVPGLGEEDEAEDADGAEDAEGADGAEDAEDADDEGGSGDDPEHGEAEEKARPRKKAPAKKAPAKKATGKPGPARKTSARKPSAGKAPTKTAAAEKAPGNKTAAKKTAARTAKKAPAKKTATAKSATRRTPRTRLSSGGGDDE
ncbi:DNA primase [Streptomyces sp. NPDC058255]|uniref:DNA primase n=1 Tax=Streptomyces sp. NPDC058255 TaxID=3346407 RepID=UPI0036E55F5F